LILYTLSGIDSIHIVRDWFYTHCQGLILYTLSGILVVFRVGQNRKDASCVWWIPVKNTVYTPYICTYMYVYIWVVSLYALAHIYIWVNIFTCTRAASSDCCRSCRALQTHAVAADGLMEESNPLACAVVQKTGCACRRIAGPSKSTLECQSVMF
jgi:hypothetical protein